MNRIDAAITKLHPNLTQAEERNLPRDSVSHFLASLLHIYEGKTARYLTSCAPLVKKILVQEGGQ